MTSVDACRIDNNVTFFPPSINCVLDVFSFGDLSFRRPFRPLATLFWPGLYPVVRKDDRYSPRQWAYLQESCKCKGCERTRSCDANSVKPRHSNSYASANEKTRPRVRRERARIEEGSCCLFSQDPVPFFAFSPSLSFFLYRSPPTAQDESLSVLLCALHPPRAHSFSLLRARVCAHAKLRVPQQEKERENGTPPHHAGLHAGGESIDVRCILPLLVPPQSPSLRVLGYHPSATNSDLLTRARRRILGDLWGSHSRSIFERHQSLQDPRVPRKKITSIYNRSIYNREKSN